MSQIFSVSHLNKGQEFMKKWNVIFRVTMGTFAFKIKQPTAMEFSPLSLFSHRGQRYPFHPLQATLTPPALLSPSSICPSFTFLLSSLPFSSNMGWPLSSLPSSFTCPTDGLFSLQPWSPDLLTPTSSPAPTSPQQPCCCLTFSTHSLKQNYNTCEFTAREVYEVVLAVYWVSVFFFLFTHVPFTCTPVHICSSNVPRRRIRKMAKKKRKKGVCAL